MLLTTRICKTWKETLPDKTLHCLSVKILVTEVGEIVRICNTGYRNRIRIFSFSKRANIKPGTRIFYFLSLPFPIVHGSITLSSSKNSSNRFYICSFTERETSNPIKYPVLHIVKLQPKPRAKARSWLCFPPVKITTIIKTKTTPPPHKLSKKEKT